MRGVFRTYRFFNLVSIDVACGAVVCGHFFSGVLLVEPTTAGLVSLGLTVWIIYTVDHLVDAQSLRKEASTKRHRLHQRHFVPISILLIAALIVDSMLILHLQTRIVTWGLVWGMVVAVYLAIHRNINPFKELMVAVLYTVGVMLPAVSLDVNPVSQPVMLLVVVFFITALINLLLFSWFESEMDLADKRESIVTIIGRTNTRRLILSLYIMQAVILQSLFRNDSLLGHAGVLATMNAVLLIIFLFPEHFGLKDRYRLVGDSVFLIPLILLAWNG